MDTSLNPCLCKDLYGYLMESCLGLGFSYLLVRNSHTSNNEVDWFSSVLGVAISCYMVVWFGCGPQWRKNLYRENDGFKGRCCPFFLKLMFLFWP